MKTSIDAYLFARFIVHSPSWIMRYVRSTVDVLRSPYGEHWPYSVQTTTSLSHMYVLYVPNAPDRTQLSGNLKSSQSHTYMLGITYQYYFPFSNCRRCHVMYTYISMSIHPFGTCPSIDQGLPVSNLDWKERNSLGICKTPIAIVHNTCLAWLLLIIYICQRFKIPLL